MGDKCARCGFGGEDRRTLWMACFYRMAELAVPFEDVQIRGTLAKQIGEEELPTFKIKIPVYAPHEGEPRDFPMYTLRVCKRCRSDWMHAIEEWFKNTPQDPDNDCDETTLDPFLFQKVETGPTVYIRDKGMARPATAAEIETMKRRGLPPDKVMSETEATFARPCSKCGIDHLDEHGMTATDYHAGDAP